jgi:hypothetical protein
VEAPVYCWSFKSVNWTDERAAEGLSAGLLEKDERTMTLLSLTQHIESEAINRLVPPVSAELSLLMLQRLWFCNRNFPQFPLQLKQLNAGYFS